MKAKKFSDILLQLKNWQKQEADRKSMMESAKRLSDLLKIIDEVDSFISSDVPKKLANYESEIETYQQSLMELMNKRKDIEQAINKLKEDVASEEIGKRELHDNITLRKTKDMIIALKEQYQKLNEKLKNMNYNELTKKWDQLENEKQALLRQVNIVIS